MTEAVRVHGGMTPEGTTPETRVDPDDWDAFVPPVGHPQIVVGGPGTGKTEFLCRRVVSAIESGSPADSIAILTFSRRSVNDIRTRLFASLGSASFQVQVSTYHSLANRIIEAHHEHLGWDRAPTVLTGPEHERFVRALLLDEEPGAWLPMYRPILATPAMAVEVTDFILRFHDQGSIVEDIERSGVPEWQGMGPFLRRYHAALEEKGRIDYGKLLNDAAMVLESDPGIGTAYEHVFADEYQDTSPIQARLLFALARHSASLTVAADPYQSIYSFRGTDLHNVLNFPDKATASLGAQADRLVLTTSFRVPHEILSAAVNVTGRELPGAAGKVASLRDRGAVDTHVFDNPDSESEWIAGDIERIHLADGVPLHRVAVFTRTVGDFHRRLTSAFERRGISHNLTVEHLQDQPVVRLIYDLVSAVSNPEAEDTKDIVRSILLGPFFAAQPGAVNDVIGRVENGESWAVAVRAVPRAKPLAKLFEDASWANELPAQDGLWKVWTSLPSLHAIANDDDRVDDRRSWSAFFQVATRLSERAENATLLDQQVLADASDIEADALFSFRSHPNQGVTVGTLHGAKGTDFDVVYIAHAIEGLLPDLRAKDSLLKTRLLNAGLPVDPVEYVQFRLNEERRLAYTAMTRATNRVVWTATELDSPSQQLEPSRFLAQVAAPVAPESHERPLTHRGFEAMLRRQLVDNTEADVDRLAALGILRDAKRHGFVDQRLRYGTVARGSDRGFMPADHVASPSAASTYDECPRRYVLERQATLKESSSFYMRFGNLIHKVLEVAERDAFEAGRSRSTLEEAEAVLDSVWDELGFGSDAVGRAWRRRAEQLLVTLFDNWPTSGDPVKVEHAFSTTLGDTLWSGKADRIEKSAGHLSIVDYKTSKTPITVDKAKSSLQLGFYVLAAMADPELAEHGDVTQASFWYVGADPNKSGIPTRNFDMERLETVRDRLIEIANAMRAERFEPTVNASCDRCDFQSVCPARREGREAFTR